MTRKIKLLPNVQDTVKHEEVWVLHVLVRHTMGIDESGKPCHDSFVIEVVEGIVKDSVEVDMDFLSVSKSNGETFNFAIMNVLRYDLRRATLDFDDDEEEDDA